jgi:putative two-component system response regulator
MGELVLGAVRESIEPDPAVPGAYRWVAEHCTRVGGLAYELCDFMGLSDAFAQRVASAAFLHDVGKWQLEPALVNKPHAFTPAERLAIQRHTTAGEAWLERLETAFGGDLATERQVALGHHERWDGSGYPQALRGRHIPLAARIVAVVDVFDALISPRPYKAALAETVAIRELCLRSGTLFDPDCVNAFVEMMALRPMDLRA